MRKYKNIDGRVATADKLPFSGGTYHGSHVYLAIYENEQRMEQERESDFWRCADYGDAFETLTSQFGYGWMRVRYEN